MSTELPSSSLFVDLASPLSFLGYHHYHQHQYHHNHPPSSSTLTLLAASPCSMPMMTGHYRPVALLLVALSALASFFYFSVWSSILDPDHSALSAPTFLQKQQQQRARVPSKDGSQPQPDLILESHHHQHQHQIPTEQQTNDGDAQTQGSTLNRPLPIPATELWPSQPLFDESSTLTDNQKEQLVVLQSVDASQLTTTLRKQLKILKDIEHAERRRKKEERRRKEEEHHRQKEEQRLRKEEQRLKKEEQRLRKEEQSLKREEQWLRKEQKLERQRQLFPALISTNNARVAALNTEAFARFCLPAQQQQQHRIEMEDNPPHVAEEKTNQKEDGQNERKQRVQGKDIAFAAYAEWMDYIHNKNTGHEQKAPVLVNESIPELLENKDDEDKEGVDQDKQQSTSSHSRKITTKPRPQFLERPLHGWIVNLTALREPCDRKIHSSAHCLAYLAQEHLYLVPSRQSREMANRRRPKHREWLPDPDLEGLGVVAAESSEMSDDDYGYNNDDEDEDEDEGEIDTEESAASTNEAYPTPMDFHIFWRGPISDKLSLAVHAFLFTQPLDRSRLHLWIDSSDLPGGKPEKYAKNPFSQDLVSDPIRQYVKIHPWYQADQESFAYPSPPSQPSETTETTESTTVTRGLTMTVDNVVPPVALSDEARFLILHRYGGMYLDADVLLLKDMSPFYDAGVEFAYEWSNTEMYNTAVLRLNKGSSVAKRILEAAKEKQGQVMEKLEFKMEHQHNQHQNQPSSEEPITLNLEIKPQQQQSHHHHHRSGGVALPKKETEETVEIKLEEHPHRMAVDTDESLFAPPRVSNITPHRLVKRGEMRPNEVFHPARLRSYLHPQDQSLEDNGLTMMPVAIFDPLWLRVDHADLSPYSSESSISPQAPPQSGEDGENDVKQEVVAPEIRGKDHEMMVEELHSFPDAFSADAKAVCPNQSSQQYQQDSNNGNEDVFSAGPEVFFMGAYAYHWHNNWHSKIESRSWMGLMRQAYDEFLAGERPNLYGEWFHD